MNIFLYCLASPLYLFPYYMVKSGSIFRKFCAWYLIHITSTLDFWGKISVYKLEARLGNKMISYFSIWLHINHTQANFMKSDAVVTPKYSYFLFTTFLFVPSTFKFIIYLLFLLWELNLFLIFEIVTYMIQF